MLADPSKPAKQTVRDVRAVAQTVFGIELDHRIVSVAQLNTNEENTPVGIELPRREARARVGSINIEAVGLRAQVRVDPGRQRAASSPATRRARSPSAARPQLVATAALDAIRQGATGGGGDPHLQRRDQPDRQQPRRGRHRRLRRPSDRARRVRVRGRATRPRRCRRARAARRHQPSSRRVERGHTLGLIRTAARRSARASRLDAARRSPTLVPARRRRRRRGRGPQVGVGAPRARFRRASRRGRARRRAPPRRRVAAVPRDRPGRRPSARTRRARGRHRRRRPRRGREPLLAPDQLRTPRRWRPPSSRSTTAASCSTITISRGSARACRRRPASRRTDRTRCTSRSTTTRACSSRTAASPRSRCGTRSTSIRRAATATRTRADVRLRGRRPRARCNRPARSRGRTSPPRSRSPTELARREPDAATPPVDHRSRGGRVRRRVRAARRPTRRPGDGRAGGRASPTPTPPPTSCSSRRPGRASATR